MTRPTITRRDVQRVIRERLTFDSDPVEQFLERRGIEEQVVGDVIDASMVSSKLFFNELMHELAVETLGEEEVGVIESEKVEELMMQVCGTVAVSFFILGWEAAEEFVPR